MSRLHSVTLVALAWVLVVLACATGVWFVIDRVGRNVLSPAPVARELPTDGLSTAYRTEAPTTPSSATSPTAVTSPLSPTATPPTPVPLPPLPSSPPTSSPPTSTSDTVAVAGGRVGAACTGSQISLWFATPESGWSFTVDTESDKVGVHFVATSGTRQTDVSARCANGAPVFDTPETGNGTDG